MRARHSRTCALGGIETKAPLREREKIPGCTCPRGPTYSIRGASGNGHERVGRDLRDAIRALHKRNIAEDEGQPVVTDNATFSEWADTWLASLEGKKTTAMSYHSTVRYAKEVLGSKRVRKLTSLDILNVKAHLKDVETKRTVVDGKVVVETMGDSTIAKHLRVLSACLQSAVQHGYAAANPVTRIPKGEKPRARKREAAYFEDAELPKLMAVIDDPLWRTLILVALKTGMREGELAALTWGDVDLGGSVIHVRRSFTSGVLGVPKSHEKREVELTEDVVRLLGEWWGSSFASVNNSGRSDPLLHSEPVSPNSDSALVFPRFGVGGHLSSDAFRKQCLYPAMERAGIERVGPTGEKRTFHSLRHTYARICLEHGCLETWLQRQLGHSSLAVTTGIYGHWSKAARRVQAAKLEGAFVV